MDNNIIYEKNMETLKKRYEGLAYIIENKKYKENEDNIEVDFEYAKDETKIISITKDRRKLYLNGKYAPKKFIQQEVEKLGDINYMAPIFIVGLGNTLFIKEILKKTEKTVNIAVYEPSISVFLRVLEEIDIKELFEDRPIGFIIDGINEEETESIIQKYIVFNNLSFLKKYIQPNYEELYPDKIIDFFKKIEKRVRHLMVLENTIIYFSNISVKNILNNVCYLCDNYQARQLIKVLPRDIPGILVSAGPSLNKNIMELKKAKNKAFIVAVDTAIKPLLKAGIEPDVVIMVDGVKPKELFEIKGAEDIPLIMSISASSQVADYHKGKKFFFAEGETYINEIFEYVRKRFYSLETGGSVATNGMSLLVNLGYSTIILVGQDLALTGNKTHADGTFKDEMDIIDTSKAPMVDGYYGDKVPTRQDFRLYLEWFNDYIRNIKNTRDINIINATEGGAKIEGADMLPLKECIKKYCIKEVNIKQEIEKLEPMFQGEERIKAVEYLHNTGPNLKKIKKDIEKEKRLYFALKKLGEQGCENKENYDKLLKKIRKLTKKIESNVTWKLIYDCIAPINYVIRSEIFCQEETLEKEIKRISKNGIAMMTNIGKCIDILLPVVEETVGKIE